MAASLAPAAYPALVLLLLGCGIGLPLSEDLLLLAGGYLAGRDLTNLWITLALCYPSVIAGDLLLYEAGRKLGGAKSPRLQRILSTKRREVAERLFERWGTLAVAISRQLIGVRAPAFVLAGASRMPRLRFLVTDSLAGLLAVPTWVVLGFYAGRGVGLITREVHWIELALAALALLSGGIVVVLQRQPNP